MAQLHFPGPHIVITLLWAATAVAISASFGSGSSYTPSVDAARQNAFHIFNAIHGAMRQWGSSIRHNGMSFFLVTVPEGQLFYHGTHLEGRPKGFEWLAFEVEHALQFARSWDPRHPPGIQPPDESMNGIQWTAKSVEDMLLLHGLSHGFPDSLSWQERRQIPSSGVQKPLGATASYHDNDEKDGDDDDDDDPRPPPIFPDKPVRGYLHTYRTTRPLNLLYIDGMAAAKFPLGSLDTQDLILRLLNGSTPGDDGLMEMQRARENCALVDEWAVDNQQIDGFIRMESGFEIIYCHFEDGRGLDLVNIMGSPFYNQTSNFSMMGFEWVRAAAQRYQGMPAGRVQIDFSSMVSAFAYPMNITNPDPGRPELPRVVSATKAERAGVRSRLREVSQERFTSAAISVNWQGVVDMIVSRFSDRLWHYITYNVSSEFLFSDIGTILNPFIDFRDAEPASSSALHRCVQHYLDPYVLLPDRFTPEDTTIHAAVEAVSKRICTTLFDAYHILAESELSDQSSSHDDVASKAQGLLRELVDDLGWSTWKECGRCQNADEVCFVAMFPFGSTEDHFTPRCKNSTGTMASLEYFLDFQPWG